MIIMTIHNIIIIGKSSLVPASSPSFRARLFLCAKALSASCRIIAEDHCFLSEGFATTERKALYMPAPGISCQSDHKLPSPICPPAIHGRQSESLHTHTFVFASPASCNLLPFEKCISDGHSRTHIECQFIDNLGIIQ